MRYAISSSIALATVLLTVFSCETEPPFTYTPELSALTGEDLDAWLSAAPFQEPWRPEEDAAPGQQVLFTNVREVFPFLGGYRNLRDDGDGFELTDGEETYRSAQLIFKDPTWGESFVQATLLYDGEPVQLEASYSTSGNMLFGGDVFDRHAAGLTPTGLHRGGGTDKARAYWVRSNQQRYLMGFLQRGQLLFQVAFPCTGTDTSACLAQLQSVNAALGLDEPSWTAATAAQLSVDDDGGDFWRDPYVRLYGYPQAITASVKTGGTELQRLNRRYASGVGADYAFGYGDRIIRAGIELPNDNPHSTQAHGYALLTLSLKPSAAPQEARLDTANAARVIRRDAYATPIYLDSVRAGGETSLRALAYVGDEQVLEVSGRYPSNDSVAERAISEAIERLSVTVH